MIHSLERKREIFMCLISAQHTLFEAMRNAACTAYIYGKLILPNVSCLLVSCRTVGLGKARKHCCGGEKCFQVFVADINLASRTQGNVIESSQKHSCFPDAIFLPKQMFPSLDTSEETMFPSYQATSFKPLSLYTQMTSGPSNRTQVLA